MTAAVRALVAEDEPLIRMMMVEGLQDAGFDVLEASDGAEAIRLIDDQDHVGVVVTDFNMPMCNGAEVAQHAREVHPTIPVLFVTARSDLLAQAGAPKPYACLRKPFTLDELETMVRRLIDMQSTT